MNYKNNSKNGLETVSQKQKDQERKLFFKEVWRQAVGCDW